jgi:hypothetical protein
MAIKGLSKFETEDYISESDEAKTKENGATIFKLGSLDVDLRAMIADDMFGYVSGQDGDVRVVNNQTKARLRAVRYGLVGWDNFTDEKGIAIECIRKTDVVAGKTCLCLTDESLAQLPNRLISELGGKIIAMNSVSGSLLGN